MLLTPKSLLIPVDPLKGPVTSGGHNSGSRRPFETLTSAFYTIFQKSLKNVTHSEIPVNPLSIP